MNIIIAVNEEYVEHAKTMLFSLASNNSEELVVYLLQSSVLPETIERFDKFMRKNATGALWSQRSPTISSTVCP